MPTLGPFFRYLRPSRLENRAQGQKPLGNDPYDDAERVWPRPHKMSPDSSLLHGSVHASESTKDLNSPDWPRPHLHGEQTRQSFHAGWDKSDAYGVRTDSLKNGMELQQTAPR